MSLFEVLIAFLLVAVLSALIMPPVKARLDMAEASAIADNLNNVRRAVVRYRDTVGRYPSHLRQLYTRPGTGGVPSTDICAGTLPAANITRWSGPYLVNPIPAAGIEVGRSVLLQDALQLDVASGEYLQIIVSGMSAGIADEVDISFDGGDASSRLSGTVTYTVGTGLMRFWIAISGC
jgi:type II secretory pathway pseudopilin PulG